MYKNRYGQIRTLQMLNDNEYLIYGESNYIRVIGDMNAVDYEGGPFLHVGDQLFNLDKTIKSIEFVKDSDKPNCYKIITE